MTSVREPQNTACQGKVDVEFPRGDLDLGKGLEAGGTDVQLCRDLTSLMPGS